MRECAIPDGVGCNGKACLQLLEGRRAISSGQGGWLYPAPAAALCPVLFEVQLAGNLKIAPSLRERYKYFVGSGVHLACMSQAQPLSVTRVSSILLVDILLGTPNRLKALSAN